MLTVAYLDKWNDWLHKYEETDPEPPLDVKENDRFEIKTDHCFSLGQHYRSDQVDAHVLWHKRMTEAYMKDRHKIA